MSNKQQILDLESDGSYVFHGSPSPDISILEPRQSKHIPDISKPTEFILDGKPAVSATPYAEIAIFRALINRLNVKLDYTSSFSLTNGVAIFRVSSAQVLEEVKNKKGYVYVFNKSDFEPYNRDGNVRPDSMEWRCYKSISPLKVIEVDYNDLPNESLIEVNK